MSYLLSLSPALVGIFIVLQSGINRKLADTWNFPTAILLNSIVVAVVAGIYFFVSGGYRLSEEQKVFSPYFILSGIFGFLIVAGAPWAIARWGATHTFIAIVAAQLVTSVLWDFGVEKIALHPTRLWGLALVLTGFIVANLPAKAS